MLMLQKIFLENVVTAYIIVAAMAYLGMSSLDAMSLESVISHDVWMEDDTVRQTLLNDISRKIVDRYVDLSTEFKLSERGSWGSHPLRVEVFNAFVQGFRE